MRMRCFPRLIRYGGEYTLKVATVYNELHLDEESNVARTPC